jgi:hypothetical protein
VGTYLGVLRGAAGPAGANPAGTSNADATAHAKALGAVAGALAAAGAVFSNGPFGPVGKAIGAAFGTIAAVLTAIAASLAVADITSPKQGHVDVDAAPTTDPTEQGDLPEGKVTLGPITAVDMGEGSGDGVGADGTSGPGGCGCGPGDPGQGLGGEI